MRRKIIVTIMSLIYTALMTIGKSFIVSDSFSYINENLLKVIIMSIITFIIFYFILDKLFDKIDNFENKSEKRRSKILNIFNEHPIIFSMVVILLCWLIYVVAFYPMILSRDPSYQLLQFFHIDNKYSYYSILIDRNVIITNHHPVVHTLLLGFCAKIGIVLFNNINVGLFIYSIIQILILSFTLSYTIYYMKKINIKLWYRLVCLLIYALVPVFPFYAMSPVKDVLFSCFVILYIIQFYEFITTSESIKIKTVVKMILLMILLILFRNNGIHLIILSFPILIIINKKNRKVFIVILLLILSFFITYSKVILPYFKITPSSVREMLSIPFQQTARYVSIYDNEVTEKERKDIDKILNYDTLRERYNKELSDPVKNGFNKYSTKEDLKNYFYTWFEMFKKHPSCYIEATINNTYGYFYPPKTNWYIYHKYLPIINDEGGFDYSYNNLGSLRNVLSTYGKVFPKILPFGLIVNIGFNNYIIIFLLFYLIYKKKYKELCYLLPSLVLILVCILSPANTYFRYALPNIFAMPILLAIFKSIICPSNKNLN